MRAVLDTNVVVSALLWRGNPYTLLQAAVEGELALFTAPVLLEELREVLAREHLAARLVQQRSSVAQAMGFYGELASLVSVLSTPRVVPDDADDDHVVAAAVAARADWIVTGDRDLLRLGSAWQGIAILTAAQAVQQLGLPAAGG